jgi:hypothetical protein
MNILYIMFDQLRFDYLSCAAPQVQPHVHDPSHADRLEPDALPPNGHVRPLSAPHADGQTRTSPYRGCPVVPWGRLGGVVGACGVVSLLVA